MLQQRPAFAQRYGPWALVAGGTDGLGLAWSHEAARRGLHVAMVGLDPAQAEAAAAEVATAHRVSTLAIGQDLADPDATERIDAALADREVGLLICNAAVSPIGDFLARDLADLERTIDVNVTTTMRLLHRHGTGMAARGRGIDTPNFRRSQPAGDPRTTVPDVVAREGLDALGRVVSWVPGRGNRAAAGALRLLPRGRAIRAVGSATRKMYPDR